MKRHLIWIIAGCATLTLAVPAIAASRDAGTPDDNGVPGEVRGNCDEAEHAGDPDCVSVGSADHPGDDAHQHPDHVPTTVPTTTTPATHPVEQRPVGQCPVAEHAVGERAVDQHAVDQHARRHQRPV